MDCLEVIIENIMNAPTVIEFGEVLAMLIVMPFYRGALSPFPHHVLTAPEQQQQQQQQLHNHQHEEERS